MILQLRTVTIVMMVNGDEIVPTTTQGRSTLLNIIKRDTIPVQLDYMYFPRIVRAGYKLAILNY